MAVQSISNDKESTGIASMGYWADKDVSVMGAYPWRQARELNKTGPSSYVLCQEAKVRGKVGDDIRWDVVLEQAAKLPCGLPSADANGASKEVPYDAISTSAGSESTPVEFEGPGSPAGNSPVMSGSDKEDLFVAPWRRLRDFSDTTANIDSSSDNEDTISSFDFPWRRLGKVAAPVKFAYSPAAATSQRYPAALLLKLGQAMAQRKSCGDVEKALVPKTMDEEKLAVKNAPWRSAVP